MNIEEAISAAVRAAIREELPRVIADELGRSRLVPIGAAGVSRRQLLSAARNGEITIFRRGHAAFVRAEDLERWILAAPVAAGATLEPTDEIAELLADNEERRRRRQSRR